MDQQPNHPFYEKEGAWSYSNSKRFVIFNQFCAEYWKQAIALTPGNYIEAQNWLKITKRFEFE